MYMSRLLVTNCVHETHAVDKLCTWVASASHELCIWVASNLVTNYVYAPPAASNAGFSRHELCICVASASHKLSMWVATNLVANYLFAPPAASNARISSHELCICTTYGIQLWILPPETSKKRLSQIVEDIFPRSLLLSFRKYTYGVASMSRLL